jgi:hypothetical protein
MYSPYEFVVLIGKTVNTVQRWDRESILPIHKKVIRDAALQENPTAGQ